MRRTVLILLGLVLAGVMISVVKIDPPFPAGRMTRW